jgi:hypothetical protein
MATLSGMHPLASETQNTLVTQQIYTTAALGSKIPTDIPSLAPYIEIMSRITASTMITTNTPRVAISFNGGGGLYGTPPVLFTGDRNKSKNFI